MRMLQSGSDLIIALMGRDQPDGEPWKKVHINIRYVSEDHNSALLKSSPLRHPDRHREMAEEFPNAPLEPVNRRYIPSL